MVKGQHGKKPGYSLPLLVEHFLDIFELSLVSEEGADLEDKVAEEDNGCEGMLGSAKAPKAMRLTAIWIFIAQHNWIVRRFC